MGAIIACTLWQGPSEVNPASIKTKGFVQHNPGLEAAQHSPGPGPLNCAVNHQLLDVQGSQGQDHCTSLLPFSSKSVYFSPVFCLLAHPRVMTILDFEVWGKKKRMLLIRRFCSLLSALFVRCCFFHVIPFSYNLLKLVIQKA